MKNILKAFFIEMCENLLIEHDEAMLNHLVEAYLKAGKCCSNIKMIRQEVYDVISNNEEIAEFYEMDSFEIISDEEFNKYINISQFAKVKMDDCDGIEVEMLVLDRFFASDFESLHSKLV